MTRASELKQLMLRLGTDGLIDADDISVMGKTIKCVEYVESIYSAHAEDLQDLGQEVPTFDIFLKELLEHAYC